MTRLDHDGPIPLYLQVKLWLEEQIAGGRVKPHRRVPSERDLSERFGVSRMTVRQALTEMVRDGQLYSRVGAGTFVADPVIRQSIRSLAAFDDGGRADETAPTGVRVLSCELVSPPHAIRAVLRLRPGRLALMVRRLHLVGEQPLMIETSYLAFSGMERLMPTDLIGSLYAPLRDRFGVVATVSEQEAVARRARPQEIALLGIDEETAVFEFTRRTFDAANRLFEHGVSVYRGDRYRFLIRLDNEGGS